MTSSPATPKGKSEFDPMAAAQVLERARTVSGKLLVDLSEAGPVLLVFLRQAGCTFCRETLRDLAGYQAEIEANGTRIVLVHMGDGESLDALIRLNGLEGVERIHDDGQELYRAFGLKRGTLRQLFGWRVVKRALLGGALARHGIGKTAGDPAQMPGFFLIQGGEIVRRFRHRSVADRPDYKEFAASAAGAKVIAPAQ